MPTLSRPFSFDPPARPGMPPRLKVPRPGWAGSPRPAAVSWLALAVLATLTLVSAGCVSSPEPHKFVWRQLSRGITSGLTERHQLVIHDEATYLKLWAEHAASLNQPALPPTVNFGREMVILVAMGSQPSGGYLIEVVDAELHGRKLTVSVGERTPPAGSLQIQRLTQPYQFVALPLLTGPVKFRTVREATRPVPPGQERPRGGEIPQTR